MKEVLLQLITLVCIPFIKLWIERGNSKTVEKIDKLDSEIQRTQEKVDEVTQIGLQNRKSNKSIISYRLHREFSEAIERGYTTSEDLSELSGLYKSYKEIGGNGKIETLFNRFKTLPIKNRR